MCFSIVVCLIWSELILVHNQQPECQFLLLFCLDMTVYSISRKPRDIIRHQLMLGNVCSKDTQHDNKNGHPECPLCTALFMHNDSFTKIHLCSVVYAECGNFTYYANCHSCLVSHAECCYAVRSLC